MIDTIKEFMPKSEAFWSLIGLAIIVICLWKTQQIYAVLNTIQDPEFTDLSEEEKERQVNALTVALYAYCITLMCFLIYSLVNFLQ